MAVRGDILAGWVEGTVRDATTPANTLLINADGSINFTNTQGSYTPAFAPGVGGQQSAHVELLLLILLEMKAQNLLLKQTLDPMNLVDEPAVLAADPSLQN